MSSQRILVAGSFVLFLTGLLYGVLYDSYLAAENRQAIVYHLDMALNMATKGDLAMASAFAKQFGIASQINEIQSRISFHLILAGAMALIPLWVLPNLDISESLSRVLALFIICGGGLWAAGDLVQAMSHPLAGRYIVLTGYSWLLIGLAGYCFYSLLAMWLKPGQARRRRSS